MDNIRPDRPSPARGPQSGPSTPPQTRWSAAGAHLGGRLAAAEANMIGAVTGGEASKGQKYANTAIEILDLIAQLHDLWQKEPPDINGAIKATWDKLENLYKTNPDIFEGSLDAGGKSFTLKSLLGAMFDGNMTYYDKADFEDFWLRGVGGSPPAILAILAVLQYKGSDMDMDFYNNPSGPENFMRLCRIMAAVVTTPESANYDTDFWGWKSSFGSFADIFPDMLMVYLYDKYIKNDTPEEWAKFRAEYNQIVDGLPKPDSKTPNYGKAYDKLQEWKETQDSWESWDDLPVGYSRDFITGDVAYPAWRDWRKT